MPPRSLLNRCVCVTSVALSSLALSSCGRPGFPSTPAGYREYAYVANSGANTVSVLDLVYLRPDRTLQVGAQPSALAVNPIRDEVYVVNTQSGSVSVIDGSSNSVVSTIAVHRLPGSIAVDPNGRQAFVSNLGSNSISVIDLDARREIAEVATPEQPGLVRLSSDARSLVVTHRATGNISVFAVGALPGPGVQASAPLRLRAAFHGCPGAGSTVILPDSSKAFVACSAGHQVLALNLAAAADSWAAKQDASLTSDKMLTLVEVGAMPVHLAMKPDGGEIFVSNTNSDSISEIATETNDVGGTYMIGTKPVCGIVSRDNGTLYVSNRGDDSISLYSIDDSKRGASLHTGSAPEAMAFSADEHLLLAVDTHSGDVSVVRTQGRIGPTLFTILPAGVAPSAIVTRVVSAHSKA